MCGPTRHRNAPLVDLLSPLPLLRKRLRLGDGCAVASDRGTSAVALFPRDECSAAFAAPVAAGAVACQDDVELVEVVAPGSEGSRQVAAGHCCALPELRLADLEFGESSEAATADAGFEAESDSLGRPQHFGAAPQLAWPRADAPVAAPSSPASSEYSFEAVFGTEGFESDEAFDVPAPGPRLRSGFLAGSSAGVWQTWPVRTLPDTRPRGSLEEELAEARELVIGPLLP